MGSSAQLDRYSDEERSLAARLFEQNYDELKRIARAKRRRAGVGETMRTIDLLHESYLKLEDMSAVRSSEHLLRAASLAMRHVIIDYARRKVADKRGGGVRNEALDEDVVAMPEYDETPEQLLAIASLMTRLEALNPRWMRVVDARYFAGMTEDEAAEVLSISPRTVRRDWRDARSWIGKQMGIAA